MHKFIFPSLIGGAKTAEFVDHKSCNGFVDPDVAVDDPHYIALSFPIATAHVPDFWVRSQVMFSAIPANEIWVFFFHENFGVEGTKV